MESYLNLKFVPSRPDPRDHFYVFQESEYKDVVDLREWSSPVDDQGLLGSCVANAITNAYELMVLYRQPKMFVDLSRLFVYYNARAYSNLLYEDSGTSIRDGLRGLKEFGVCKESLWPYAIENFDDRPTEECYKEAYPRRIKEYQRVSTLVEIMELLDKNFPVITGINIYPSFNALTEDSPVLPLPGIFETRQGEHAVVLVGYDMSKEYFIAKNSYGPKWGLQGYCYIPFSYMKYESFENWYFDIPTQE